VVVVVVACNRRQEEETGVVAQLKQRREAILAQLNELRDSDGGDKRARRQTRAQKKDTVKYDMTRTAHGSRARAPPHGTN
jgi:cell division protein FtsB